MDIKCEPDEDCVYCGGTGRLVDAQCVYPGEAHWALVGSSPCVCTVEI